MSYQNRSNDNVLAAIAWGGQLFSFGIVTLIIYLVSKDNSFVRRHAAMAMTGWLVWTVCGVLSALLMIVLVGFVTGALVGIWALVICVMGIVSAISGKTYSPAVLTGLCRSIFHL
jgi:uncharacterized membrane protein